MTRTILSAIALLSAGGISAKTAPPQIERTKSTPTAIISSTAMVPSAPREA